MIEHISTLPTLQTTLTPSSQRTIPKGGVLDEESYKTDIDELEKLTIWSGNEGVRELWNHQKEAITQGVFYLFSTPKMPDGGLQGALIKMPTGTGKSGVVAVLSRCLPNTRKVLVLTPREALTDQMKDDISFRFWRNMKATDTESGIWSGPGVDEAKVEKLLPNSVQLKKITEILTAFSRVILVGTLQALDQLRLNYDKISRALSQGEAVCPADLEKQKIYKEALTALRNFDLVIVDEGHYEPAPSWSRSVRSLARPTILLSATPFRNDYKLFSVRGNHSYNFPFPKALELRIVRRVVFFPAETREFEDTPLKSDDQEQNNKTSTVITAGQCLAVSDFVDSLCSQVPLVLEGFPDIRGKIIVRARSFEILVLLQEAIERKTTEHAILIHEQVNDSANKGERRYVGVTKARMEHPDARYWLHQSKLLEGIDEPSFVAVALFDEFSNARQLVQQIGRVLRSTDPGGLEAQTATVIVRGSNGCDRVREAWERYLEFERYSADNLGTIIAGESYLPEKIIPEMPDYQYIDGQFRKRLPLNVALTADDILLPRRTAIFDVKRGFSIERVREEMEEAILSRNRFVVQRVTGLPSICLVWTFFKVDESPYLAKHYVTEWRLGVCLVAHINNRLFMFDSDGIALEPDVILAGRVERDDLTHFFPEAEKDTRTAITNISAHSLDMSDRSIRSMSSRTRSFAETFSDLLDAVMIPTTVSGYVNGIGRYLGFSRAKVTEGVGERVSINEYLRWLEQLDSELSRGSKRSVVFDRYAQLGEPDPEQAKKPMNILLDLTREAMEEFGLLPGNENINGERLGSLAYEDLCADIDGNGKFEIKRLDGTSVHCSIKYDEKTRRYKIISDELNMLYPATATSGRRTVMTLTQQINAEQAFRVLSPQLDVVYIHGEFVKTRDMVVGGSVLPLQSAHAIEALKKTTSEKGEQFFADHARWHEESILGLTDAYVKRTVIEDDEYCKAFEEFDLILLDDGGDEIGDILCVGPNKVAIIHAKASKEQHYEAVAVLQEVGRQAVASLAFCSTVARTDGIADDRWNRKYTANKTRLTYSRVMRNNNKIPKKNISSTVRVAMRNPSLSKEIWIVAGRLTDINGLRDKAKSNRLTNRQRQLLMYIDGLTTACARANSRLRIFGS